MRKELMEKNPHGTEEELKSLILGFMSTCTIVNRSREMIFRGELSDSQSTRLRDVRKAIRARGGSFYLEVVDGTNFLVATFPKYVVPAQRWAVHLALFLSTVVSTLAMGAFLEGVDPLQDIRNLSAGLPFAATIMGILLFHEMGHYFAARRYGLDVTLPYFIPFPTIFGTMGAFIKIRSPIHNRRMLMEIGAAGPIAGLMVAIPAVIYGLKLSSYQEVSDGGLFLGSSLLFTAIERFVIGSASEGNDLFLHPIAFAGWGGLFVTAMNLFPIGQLDGGHVSYALFGSLQRRISTAFFLLLIPLGYFWPGWLIWVVLILLLVKIPHPPVIYEDIPLGGGRKIVGWIVLLLFILTFVPTPIRM
jgi:membrane-associated protease RseP (regulator of RpoE activity)